MTDDTRRRIILARHAKSAQLDMDDHERPLAGRGRRDAPEAGRWLESSGNAPELVRCSTAARTRETWKLMSAELSQRPETVYNERLYGASLGALLAVVKETSDEVGSLLLVGHNPGMPALADALAGESDDDLLARMIQSGFPTSAIAVLTFTGSWQAIEPGSARMVAYWTPRDHG